MSNKRKSFTGQMFDFILDEKNFTKKNMIIFVLIIGIVGFTGVMLLVNREHSHNGDCAHSLYNNDLNKSILEEYGYSKAELEEMDEETLLSLSSHLIINTRNQVAGRVHDGELSYEKSLEIKNKFYQYASEGNYDLIINEFNKIKSSNYLSMPYNQKLIRIYNDAYAIRASLEDSTNRPMQESALSNLNDERMLLIMLLSSDLEVRNNTLKDRMSLTLSKDDNSVKINSVTSSSMGYNAKNELYKQDVKMEKMLNYINEGEFIIYKISFNVGNEAFNAYLYRDIYKMKLCIYGIYPDELYNKSTNYITVAESAQISSYMESYENSIDNEDYDPSDTGYEEGEYYGEYYEESIETPNINSDINIDNSNINNSENSTNQDNKYNESLEEEFNNSTDSGLNENANSNIEDGYYNPTIN